MGSGYLGAPSCEILKEKLRPAVGDQLALCRLKPFTFSRDITQGTATEMRALHR